jgi:hypothetical protein
MGTNTPASTSDAAAAIAEQTDITAAGMLGLDLKEFRGMTHLAKTQYRNLAHNLLQVFHVVPKSRIDKARALKLDPAKSTTPHCIEEYNAGVTNAVNVLQNGME